MSGAVSFPLAFAAGFVSFLSPCVLPLLPAYLSFMTGLTTAELSDDDRSTAEVMLPALLFVLGFSVVFVGLGASASLLGALLSQYRGVIEKVAGLAVVAFGVLMLGIVKVPWLYGEARADLSKARSFGRGAALVMGMAFAAGWTPCVGPILGSILALAGSSGSVTQGALLLLAYSAGLGVPFLAVALLFGRVRPLLAWLSRHSLAVNRTAGVVLIVVGALIFFGRLSVLANYLSRALPSLGV
ncbi:MAG TPA: cytochrome c biogenesis protein CcdA [Coriobacteriia bacterium]